MESRPKHSVFVLTTGFVVLLLLLLPLFWARWSCETTLSTIMPRESKYIRIQPSGLVPSELENDPNIVNHSEVYARMRTEEPAFLQLGIANYLGGLDSGGWNSNIYYLNKDRDSGIWSWIYFDEKTGQIDCHYRVTERLPNGTLRIKEMQQYVGPEGVSEIADKKLGRFIRPIIDISWYRQFFILYDKQLRCFYKINLKEKTVTKGPELSKDKLHNPIQIGFLRKNDWFLSINWIAPQIKTAEGDPRRKRYSGSGDSIPIVDRDFDWNRQYILVLDKTGRIDLMDREALEFIGPVGYLPVPETFFPSVRSVIPKDLLAYEVYPLALDVDQKYKGLYAASINRESTAMTLSVFNEEGRLIRQKNTDFTDSERYHGRPISTSKAVYWDVPWAPTLTISKYLLENLQPPVLSLLSYFTADKIEAGAGHRALFIMPDSFIAMKGQDIRGNMTERFLAAMLIILPSILLSIFLAWRISINAIAIGLSENSRILWIIATVAFGVVSYITYRLTKPTITLVTCANCGRMRRPDMEKCHRCGSKWHVPELIPPTWRVLDGENQVSDSQPAIEAETATE
jgi:hypothetical protein